MRKVLFSLALLVLGSFPALSRQQPNARQYGPVMVVGLTPEQGSELTGKMTTEVYSALRQEGKVRVVGEPQLVRSPDPSATDLVKLADARGARWIALVDVSPLKESRASLAAAAGVYSVQVVHAVSDKIISRSYAVFGYLMSNFLNAVARARDAITELVSEHREIRVVFDILTRPGEAEYSMGASSVKETSKDGLGHWEGTQPVGTSLVRVWKQGYGAEQKSFPIKPEAGYSYLPLSLVVHLKAGNSAHSPGARQ